MKAILCMLLLCFAILACQTKQAPAPMVQPTEIKTSEVKPEVPQVVKAKPTYIITKVSKVGNTYKVQVNQATLKNKNLRVRLQIGYVQYDGQARGKITSITPDWTPSGHIYVGIWDTQTSRYVSSVRVGG